MFIINILLNIFSIYYCIKLLKNTFWYGAIFLAFSSFIFTSSHYFSIESLSLLSSGILWSQVYIFLKNHSYKTSKNAFFIGIWCGITLLINYKFIVVLPFMTLALWTIKNDIRLNKTLFFKVICYTSIGFIIPIIFLMILGSILGLAWYQYPATLYSIFLVSGNPNPTSYEFGYYFSYFLYFENFLIVIVFIGRLFLWRLISFSIIEKFLMIVFIGVFVIMCFLPKAPRGLIFVLPLIYIWLFIFIENFQEKVYFSLLKKRILVGLFWISSTLQIYRVFTNLYFYKETSYPKVAQYLKNEKAKVVFTTLGAGIYPYLDKSVRLEILRDISDTIKFNQFTGKKYLLYDAFCETAGHKSLYVLKQKEAILKYPEKSILAPSLFLENSEYTGISFQKSLELQQNMRKEKYQLLLIPLP
ncbi:MAG: hypothetical protein MUC49_09910 [Raineya sp.]|nr:hypothetical protein [Raineya sp.]